VEGERRKQRQGGVLNRGDAINRLLQFGVNPLTDVAAASTIQGF
jgi:hypothetical protein